MLESSLFSVQSIAGPLRSPTRAAAGNGGTASTQPVFRMEQDPEGRIDGGVPVWDSHPDAATRIAGTLDSAGRQAADSTGASADHAANYASAVRTGAAPEPFGFGDLVDMVNPLQHIPLVNSLYRYITGDQIKPVAQVVGDTIYGGPIGAALSASNVILKEATGRDVTGHLMAMAFNEPSLDAPAGSVSDGRETQPVAVADATTALADSVHAGADVSATNAPDNDRGIGALAGLPGSAIGFADLRGKAQADTGESLAAIAPAAGLPQPQGQRLQLASFSAFDIY